MPERRGAPPQAFLFAIPIPPFWSYHGDVEGGSYGCLTCTGEDGGTRGSAVSTLQGSARKAGRGPQRQLL